MSSAPSAIAKSRRRFDYDEDVVLFATTVRVGREQMTRVSIRFQSQIISPIRFQEMDQFFHRIISTDQIGADQLAFTDITRNRGRLLLLEAILNFVIVGGSCGVDFGDYESNRSGGTELFCIWNPRNDINPKLLGRPTGKPLAEHNQTAVRLQFESVLQNREFLDAAMLRKIINPQPSDRSSDS